jgi:hypothetical protein
VAAEEPRLQRFDAAGGALLCKTAPRNCSPGVQLVGQLGRPPLSPRPTPGNEGLRVWIMGLSGLQLLSGVTPDPIWMAHEWPMSAGACV